jgi:hypothetical protein
LLFLLQGLRCKILGIESLQTKTGGDQWRFLLSK